MEHRVFIGTGTGSLEPRGRTVGPSPATFQAICNTRICQRPALSDRSLLKTRTPAWSRTWAPFEVL